MEKNLVEKVKKFINYVLFLGGLLILISSCSGTGDELPGSRLQFIAVQIEKGDRISIINAKGEVVVDEEYDSEDKISRITDDGVYWVQSGKNNKFSLYSVESAKKPINNEEYLSVTDFKDGVAFACKGDGTPIQIINSKGETVKTVCEDVRSVYSNSYFSENNISNLFPYSNAEGKFGYINNEGEIIIPAKYTKCSYFSEGFTFVVDDSTAYIINEQGEKVGQIDKKYHLLATAFHNNMIPVEDASKDMNLVYLNKNGEVALELPEGYYSKGWYDSNFKGGYALVRDKDYQVGLIDTQGSLVFRFGKYNDIHYLGNNTFIASKIDHEEKGYEFTIIDHEDNKLIPQTYNSAQDYKLGDYFIMYDGHEWVLVSPNGEENKDCEFEAFAELANTQEATFINIEAIADDVVSVIDNTGYKPFQGKKKLTELVKEYGVNTNVLGNRKQSFDIDTIKADAYPMEVFVHFNENALKEKSHIETVSDGWFAYQKRVFDGYEWNEDAKLDEITLSITNLPSGYDYEKIWKKIQKKLVAKNFKLYGPANELCEYPNGDKFLKITSTTNEKDNTIHIFIRPFNDYSEANVEY